MMEVTPMYVGFINPINVTYASGDVLKLGGLIEPIGFGSPTRKDFCGLTACPRNVTALKPPPFPYSIANATGSSSWAPGGGFVWQAEKEDINGCRRGG